MSNFNDQFIFSIIIITLGYLLKRKNIIKESDGDAISRIVFNLTLPCLIMISFNNIKIDFSLIFIMINGFVYGIFLAFLGFLVFKKESRRIKGMMMMIVPGFNIGLFAYPLVEGIWGQEGIKYFGMFDMGNAFIVFGLTYLIGSFYSSDKNSFEFKQVFFKMSRSIPLLTYISICTISIIGLQLPSVILDVAGVISKANMPLSLVLLGIYLDFSLDKSYFNKILKYLTLRYAVGLSVGLFSFFVLPFDNMFRYTILLALILPMSFSALVYAVQFNYDKKLIGTVSNLTILISFVLLWGIGNLLL
ncbi:AEC family transporter [Neobacillus sp. 3P2-tot-E-2]|uniref:AEC family transporter n=1 Tax=Neobacillus sp. 3P2-tot-E-2 TaxID=3132212 RepID=UPI00399F087E